MWPDYVGSWGLTGHAQPVRRGLSLTRTGTWERARHAKIHARSRAGRV
jgi:hypothetical protein